MAWKRVWGNHKKKERGKHWPPKGNADRVHSAGPVLAVCICADEMYLSGNSFSLLLNDDKRNDLKVEGTSTITESGKPAKAQTATKPQ